MVRGVFAVRYIIMFAFLLLLFALGNSHLAYASVNSTTLTGIVDHAITNQTVQADITSNVLVASYLANSTALDYFINSSIATNSALSNPILLPFDGNAVALIALLNNPSFPIVIANYTQFDSFVGDPAISSITGNPVLLGCLLSNPALGSVFTNPAGLVSLITSSGFAKVTGNSAAYCNLLSNPGLPSIMSNNKYISSFLTSSSSIAFISNAGAFSNFLTNPDFVGIITSANFTTFLNSPSYATFLSSATFVNFVGNPAFASFINSPSLGYVLANPSQLMNMINNQALVSITGNPIQFASLLGNPALKTVLTNATGLTTLVASPSFAIILNTQPALSDLLSNPALSSILANPQQMITFLGSTSIGSLLVDPVTMSLLFSNPSLSGIINNPAGLGTLLANPAVEGMAKNVTVFSIFLTSPSLLTIVNNPNAFTSILGTSQFGSILSNSNQTINFINNPSLGGILANPALMLNFLSNPSLAPIVNSNPLLGSLLGNPQLSSVVSNPSGLATLISSPGFASILNNQQAFAALLGNPSIIGIISNPSLLLSFISNPSFSLITSNSTIMTSFLANPQLSTILGNQASITNFINNQLLSGISNNSGVLASLMSNPSFLPILNNPIPFINFVNNSALDGVSSSPTFFDALLSNPSLTSVLNNPTPLIGFINNTGVGVSNFATSPAFASLLSNPSLGTILSNPSALSSIMKIVSNMTTNNLNNTSFNQILKNPSIINLLLNPSLPGILNNPTFNMFLTNPATTNFTSSRFFGRFLGNVGLGNIFGNPSLTNMFSGPVLVSVFNNPTFGGLLGNSQFSTMFGGGLFGGTQVKIFAKSLLSNIFVGTGTQTGGCSVNTPWTGICDWINTDILTTQYGGYAGNGRITQLLTVGVPTPTPLILSVLNQNTQNAGWLITCPVTPDPHNSIEYFSSAAGSYIAGNRCLADLQPLVTSISLFTGVFWTPFSFAVGTNYYTVSNLGNGWSNSLAYSGLTSTPPVSTLVTVSTTSSSTVTSSTSTTVTTTIGNAQCPNVNYYNNNQGALTKAQVMACAQNAGFSGDQQTIMVAIAAAESGYNPAATGGGTQGGCTAQGILQEGKCGSPGEAYPLNNYDPTKCSTYNNGNPDWTGIYYNPTCAFQWAYAFVTHSPPITNRGTYVCNQPAPNGGEPYCFWGTYWLDGESTCSINLNGNSCYCKFMPTTYNGFRCSQGGGNNGGGGGGGGGGNGGGNSGDSGQFYNLSNGFDTQSNIFVSVPSSVEHGLWTWSAKYANLQKTDLSQLKLTKTLTGLMWEIPLVCDYTYDYTITSAIASINNTNVSIPQFNKSALNNNKDWLNFSGYLFSPVTKLSTSDCHDQLMSGFACGGWTKVSTNGTLQLSGTKYSGLNVYYGSTDYSSDPNPDFKQSLIAVYSNGYGEVNAIALSYGNVTAVPVIWDGITMPTSYTQISNKPTFLNESFNLYSTHNYVNPTNSLDQFSLFTDTGFFASYNGYLAEFNPNVVSLTKPDSNSFSGPQTNFTFTFDNPVAAKSVGWGTYIDNHLVTFDKNNASKYGVLNNTPFINIPPAGQGPPPGQNPQTFGHFIIGQIHNPAYIAATPTGYVYVINYSQDCGWFGCGISSTTIANLFTFRFIPQGYYNLTYYQPGAQLFQSKLGFWNSLWQGYFSKALLDGSQNLYLIGIDRLSSTKQLPLGFSLDKGGILGKVIPLSVQSDDNGDLFILGASLGGLFGKTGFTLAGLLPPGGSGPNSRIKSLVTMPKDFIPGPEFAVSPGGQFVYVANATCPLSDLLSDWCGGVQIYSTFPAGGSGNGNGGGGGGNFGYVSSIPLSYSNSTSNLNLTAYLAAGGPFNDSEVSSAWNGVSSQSWANDISFNHHPISIANARGILYVLDNWTFIINQKPQSILMLRAFTENGGAEIPINPTKMNDFISTLPGVNGIVGPPPLFGWKPYGWPISANLTLPDGKSISYCAVDCTNGPYDVNALYPPIGPRMEPYVGEIGSGANSIAISSDFNGTLYLIAHSWKFDAGKINCIGDGGKSICFGYGVNPNKPLYTELLAFHPNIQNYTQTSYLENSSYLCYLNISDTTSNNPCKYDQQTANVLGNIYPPVLGVPNVFSYVQSLGGPEQYLNVQNAGASLFPGGIDSSSYKQQQQNELNSGLSNAPNYNNLGTQPLKGGSANGNVLNSYIKSDISGYVVIPYNITIVLNQTWNFYAGVPLQPGIVCPPFPLSIPSVQNHYKYVNAALKDQGPLNTTIEGGGTYAQYLPLQNYYVQNLSDAGLIISPVINYQVFTNRLFGEVFVNQTISPSTTGQNANSRSNLPVVVNASRLQNYFTTQFQQVSTFGINPAYYVQNSIPANPTVIGANCGGSCPPNYYYSNKYFTGNNNFGYLNETILSFFQLFEVFKRASYVSNVLLNFSNEKSIIGYNRFVYTYVDRFNNTIYMPVDVNFANITSITTNSAVVINSINTNQSNVIIQGTAFYTTPAGITHPIPKGSNIYLYWNTNINFFNATSQSSLNYFIWAVRCAFAPASICKIANPLSTQTQTQPNGGQEANAIDYHTNIGSNGMCPMQPNSLILPITYNCNVFGSYNLQTARNDPNNQNNYDYCIPFFVNGTGLFSSQLGLIKVVQTDANGVFQDNAISACGVGQNRIVAYYYGTSAPEPLNVSQSWLGASGGIGEFGQKIDPTDIIKSPEFNYSYAPGLGVASFEIGTYALSFGSVGTAGLIVVILAVAVILWKRAGAKKNKRK